MGTPFRRYGPKFRMGGYLTPGIKWLIIANVAVFFVQTVVRFAGGDSAWFRLNQWFGAVPYAVTHGYVWQLLTYLFLHAGIWHILMNLLVLWMFGSDLERYWGWRRFLKYYLVCGAGAGLFNVIVKTIQDPGGTGAALIPTIGASGAIYGILLGAALVFPDRQVWVFPFPVMLPMRIFVLVIGAITFFGSLGANDIVSHVSHLGGMLVGWLYLRQGSFLYGARNWLSDVQRRRARRKFEVYMRRKRDEPPSQPDDWVN